MAEVERDNERLWNLGRLDCVIIGFLRVTVCVCWKGVVGIEDELLVNNKLF